MTETSTATASSVIRRNCVNVSGRENGPVVMFAHGFGCDQDMWRKLLPYFADQYRLVLFDHVGAGGSDASAYDPVKYGSLDGYIGGPTRLSDTRYVLDGVRTEALILQCSEDLLAPPEVGSYLHRRLEGSTLVQLPATGHCPHVSMPEATADAILGFLAVSP